MRRAFLCMYVPPFAVIVAVAAGLRWQSWLFGLCGPAVMLAVKLSSRSLDEWERRGGTGSNVALHAKGYTYFVAQDLGVNPRTARAVLVAMWVPVLLGFAALVCYGAVDLIGAVLSGQEL